jgi:hypothetical protein
VTTVALNPRFVLLLHCQSICYESLSSLVDLNYLIATTYFLSDNLPPLVTPFTPYLLTSHGRSNAPFLDRLQTPRGERLADPLVSRTTGAVGREGIRGCDAKDGEPETGEGRSGEWVLVVSGSRGGL